MGLILDSSILIASERKGESVKQVLSRIQRALGETEVAISAVTVVEFTHGIYRAKTEVQSRKRRVFTDEICRDVPTYPVTLDIARLAGRVEGEQAALGHSIAFQDLIIGSTALYLGFDLVTLNVKHFLHIPALRVVDGVRF